MSPRQTGGSWACVFSTSLGPCEIRLGDLVLVKYMDGPHKCCTTLHVLDWGAPVGGTTYGVVVRDARGRVSEWCGDSLAWCKRGGILQHPI